MSALPDQMQIEISKEQTEAVGILQFLNGVRPVNPNPVGILMVDPSGKQPIPMHEMEPVRLALRPLPQNLDGPGARHEHADNASATCRMLTEDRERIPMPSVNQSLNTA
jgi:hypothetical protein